MALPRGLIVGAAALAVALHGAAAGSSAKTPAAASGAFLGDVRRAGDESTGKAEGQCRLGSAGGGRLERIAAIMAPSFAAAPKDRRGGVAPAGARHLLRTYFGIERGWRLPGLETHAWQANGTRGPGAGASKPRWR